MNRGDHSTQGHAPGPYPARTGAGMACPYNTGLAQTVPLCGTAGVSPPPPDAILNEQTTP